MVWLDVPQGDISRVSQAPNWGSRMDNLRPVLSTEKTAPAVADAGLIIAVLQDTIAGQDIFATMDQ
jgi:hypothetical protein